MPELIPSRTVTRDAGPFQQWLSRYLEGRGSGVPCDGCTACCESGYFIHVTPEDSGALARIPEALLFPAPGRPQGHYVMGFDEHGRCPMLQEKQCGIYEDRPQTCRDFDCRVFTATGIAPGGEDKAGVHERASQWRFGTSDPERIALTQLQRVGAWLMAQPDAPDNPSQQALLSIALWRDLNAGGSYGDSALREALRARIERRRNADSTP